MPLLPISSSPAGTYRPHSLAGRSRHFFVEGKLEVFDLTLKNGNPSSSWCGGSLKFGSATEAVDSDSNFRNVRFEGNVANGCGGAVDAMIAAGRVAKFTNAYFLNNEGRSCGSGRDALGGAIKTRSIGTVVLDGCMCDGNMPNNFHPRNAIPHMPFMLGYSICENAARV